MNLPKPSQEKPARTLERLKNRRDFLRVAKRGRKWATRGLVLQAWRRSGDELPDVAEDAVRVGFTMTKKVGTAVVRNRVRRRLKAVAETVFPGRCREGRDLVLIGRATTATRPFDALVDDLRLALRKLGAERPDGGAAQRGNG